MAKKYIFHKERRSSNPYRVLAMLIVVIGGLFLLQSYDRAQVKPLFDPTPTATRTSNSFALEGQTQFQAGDLNKSIAAYQQAVQTEPENARLWMELARIQTYSSSQLTTAQQRKDRLAQALESVNKAVKLAPDDSTVNAVRAFVLDWNATYQKGDGVTNMLIEAEKAAQRALLLDKNNVLALAYSAEITLDEQKLDQAQQYMNQALERGKDLMDVHRVNATLQETYGRYSDAIASYDRAIELAPNLTFLYIRVGVIYRFLGMNASSDEVKNLNYEKALDYFDRAVKRNQQLGFQDPNPYIAIGKVYTQQGQFYAASLNVKKALQIDPYSQDIYGELGMVYVKARNYEASILALQCAVEGCPAEVSCEVRECDLGKDPKIDIVGIPIQDTSLGTVVYYYSYGSVLAGMYRPVGPTKDYCTRAMAVFSKVRGAYSEDKDVMYIVRSGENICNSYNETSTPELAPGSGTLTPSGTLPAASSTPTVMPTATLAPSPTVTPLVP